MSNVLEIIKPGLQASIQGDYRYGYLGQGIPPSGPMDEFSHHIGNLIVGNKLDAPSIEYALVGGKIKFLKDTVIALTGSEYTAKLNGNNVKFWEAFSVKSGDILDLGYAKNGCRGYLSIAGGFNVPVVLGSTSTYASGFIGGYRGRNLIQGDILSNNAIDINSDELVGRSFVDYEKLFPGNENVLYVTQGPQFDHYTDESISEFFGKEWETSDKINRIGVRFEGLNLKYKDRVKDPDEGKNMSNIIDDGIPMGGMQTPGGTEMICMAKDVVSAGGFTKIGVVVTASLDTLGQLVPGKKVKFELISVEEAMSMRKEKLKYYDEKHIKKS